MVAPAYPARLRDTLLKCAVDFGVDCNLFLKKPLEFEFNKMSDNTLDWTMPPPTADGSIEHESHGDETACLLEGKKRKTRSPMWQHFTAVPGKVKQAQCNYCDTLIMYKDGTSGMRNHLKRCDDYDGNTEVTQPKKRRKINAQGQVVSSPSVCKFDQAACRA
ncbi:FBD-associated F-box protein [Trifolium repens]|nr:FBD-associated F-box protein [Trifolium repens]